MKFVTYIGTVSWLLWAGGAVAESVQLEKGVVLEAPGATRLQVRITTPAGVLLNEEAVPTTEFRDQLVLNDTVIAAIKDRIPPGPSSKATLVLSNSALATLKEFPVRKADGPSAPAIAAGIANIPEAESPPAESDSGDEPAVAIWAQCTAAAETWKAANPKEWNRGKDTYLVLFNSEPRVCYESTQHAQQGDTIFIGIVRSKSDAFRAKADLSQCSREPVQPNIYVSGDLRLFAKQSSEAGWYVQILESRRCWDKDITVTASVRTSPTEVQQGTRGLSFYERFRGTVQLGVLYTDLHEKNFGLRTENGQQVIYDKEAEEKGPEYVASLVVYGFPKYFTKEAWKKGYRGRDILNEHDWTDRLGLTLLAGIDAPSERFGVGLSFELAYGINVFWTKEWFKQRQLVGIAEGDVFTGTEDAITTKREWENDSAFGLSFDYRYITSLFNRQ